MSDVGPGSKIEHRFKLRSELARAGELRVFVASDAITGERFEAHVLDASASEEARLAFSQEAEILSRVDDRAFLPVVTVGALPGGDLYYIAAERSATRISDRMGALSKELAARVAAQLLEAVARLHAVGWFLGWLHPEHVDESPFGDGVRIVRLSFARPSGREGPPVDATRDPYADPRLVAGEEPSVATDLGCIGRLVRALVDSGEDDSEFWHVIKRLEGATEPAFEDAAEAADAFQTLMASAAMVWPGSKPTSRRLRDTDTELIISLPPAVQADRSSAEVIAPAPLPTMGSGAPVGTAMEPRPSSGKRWAAIAAVAAVLVGAVVVLSSGDDSSAAATPSQDGESPVAAAAAGTPDGAAVAAPANAAPSASSLDPIRAVAALNRTELDSVLRYGERHALLERVSERPELQARIDPTWHRLLDLAQAADSSTPCTTFREALEGIESAPTDSTHLEVWKTISAPTPETVLGAGRSPDGSCDGLPEAFAAMTGGGSGEPAAKEARVAERSKSQRKSRSRKASSASAPAPAPAPSAPPASAAPAPKPTKKSTGVTRLDDIKSVK